MLPIDRSVEIGRQLVPLSLQLNKAMFAAGDLRTIHNDDEAARREGLPGAIAVGPQVAALIFRMMRMAFGDGWIRGGSSSLTFRRATGSDDLITAHGRVLGKEMQAEGLRVSCDVWVENGQAVRTVVGSASALVA